MPPRTAAAMIGTRKAAPVVSLKVAVFKTSATPAIPHRAPDTSQAASITWSVAIPLLRARPGLVAVARIALPSWVRVSRRWTQTIATTAIPMIASWLAVNTIEPRWYDGPWDAW